jgi:hypothetical protein
MEVLPMASFEPGKRLWSLGLFVLPLAAVKVAAMVLGGGTPHAASASQNHVAADAAATGGATQAGTARIEWTPAQRAAAAHVRALDAVLFGPAPMLYAPQAVVVHSEPEPAPIVVLEKPAPQFVLHAVMTAPNGNKALINGRMQQVGEQIGTSGWFVQEINIDERSVVVHHNDDGETLTITVHRPG